jgi:hypothetical protein
MEAVKLWSGFNYEPVPEIANRVARRKARAERKSMLRFFGDRGFGTLAARMLALKLNPRLNAVQKREQFARILDDYVAEINRRKTEALAAQGATEAGETSPEISLTASDVALQGGDVSSMSRGSGDGVQQMALNDAGA